MEVAERAIAIEARTNLLFLFEKMAIRDAVKSIQGACGFAVRLYESLVAQGTLISGARSWANSPQADPCVDPGPSLPSSSLHCDAVKKHVFPASNVTRKAAGEYGFEFRCNSTPSSGTYDSLLDFAEVLRRDIEDLHPKDTIDIQSCLLVLG